MATVFPLLCPTSICVCVPVLIPLTGAVMSVTWAVYPQSTGYEYLEETDDYPGGHAACQLGGRLGVASGL